MKIKRVTFYIFLLFIGFFFFQTPKAQAEVIREYKATISLNEDSSILVEEKIRYDFETSEKHGIYREIPLKNANGWKIKIKNISVTDENGSDYFFSEKISNGKKIIKIGNNSEFVTGVKEYNISYQVFGAITYFKEFDEIYWNVSGNDWAVPIEKIEAWVLLPNNATPIKTYCYYGYKGESNSCQQTEGTFFFAENLISKQGLTISVSFLKNIVYEPSFINKIFSFTNSYVIILLPFITFFLMLSHWQKKGKDPKGQGTIVAFYEPPKNIKPTLIGSLIDERVDMRDITAGLIYLAEQGYLKINKIDKKWILGKSDYEIELVNEGTDKIGNIENKILNVFFPDMKKGDSIKLSDLKNDTLFHFNLSLLDNIIFKEMVSLGLYEKNPNNAKIPYLIGPFFVVPLLIFILGKSDPISIISIIISCSIIFIFGFFMSKKTKLGAITKEQILGFKEFLSVTEKDRLDFHNAPEKNPEKFMEFLPYAIALGVEDKWAKKFEGIYLDNPSWYTASSGNDFMARGFASELSSFGSSFSASSGSSGGGSQGGGGGGGGGGSW